MIELEAQLAEVAQDPPCGPDLDENYDPEFRDLELAAQGKPEQQYGDTIEPAVEPNWLSVAKYASALLARSKDVRLAVYLTRALAHTEGLAGFYVGLQVVYGLLERYWDDLHPRLDAAEDNDPTMRLNALASLADPQTMLRDLRNAFFIRSRQHGQILVRDVEIAAGKLTAFGEGVAPSLALIESAIREAAEDNEPEPAIVAARMGAGLTTRLSTLLVEKVGAERAIDLRPLMGTFVLLRQICDRAMPETVLAADAEVRTAEQAEKIAPLALAAAVASGELCSRDDAVHMLDKVCQYLERNEPTNPAPLLIRRASKLMNMSFVEIIQNLAPESMANIQSIAGLDRE